MHPAGYVMYCIRRLFFLAGSNSRVAFWAYAVSDAVFDIVEAASAIFETSYAQKAFLNLHALFLEPVLNALAATRGTRESKKKRGRSTELSLLITWLCAGPLGGKSKV